MIPADIKTQFELYRTGKITLEQYHTAITPTGRKIEAPAQTMTLPFFDAAKNQADKILSLLQDGLPHSTDEISKRVYGADHAGTTRIGARIFDLRKRGYDILGFADKDNRSLFYYQLKQKWYAE